MAYRTTQALVTCVQTTDTTHCRRGLYKNIFMVWPRVEGLDHTEGYFFLLYAKLLFHSSTLIMLTWKAREATDAKEASNNQEAHQAETISSADQDSVLRQGTQPSLESYLLKHPAVQKLFGKLSYKMGNVTCVMEEMRFVSKIFRPIQWLYKNIS